MKISKAFGLVAAIAITFAVNNANAQGYTIDLDQNQQMLTKDLYTTPTPSTEQQLLIVPPTLPTPPAPRLGFEGQMIHGMGMKVLSVIPGSPAAKVGLEYGDIILSINHLPVSNTQAYRNALIQAVDHHQGVVQLNVKNVRGCVQHGIPEYVNVTAFLLGPPTPAIVAASPQLYHN